MEAFGGVVCLDVFPKGAWCVNGGGVCPSAGLGAGGAKGAS
jgi:hypothetical protein